jgi:recombination protein RecT
MTRPTTDSSRAREHAGMAQPGKELSRFERERDERIAVVKSMLPAFQDALSGRKELAERIIRDAITAIRTTPKLVECTQPSFLGALMTAAQLNLRPNLGATGHCWVLPFRDNKNNRTLAQFVLGYRGMTTLAYRSGIWVDADTVYPGDLFRLARGSDRRLIHEPVPPSQRADGDPVGHYAFARAATGEVWRFIWHEEALAARDRSPGYVHGGPDNPWRQDAQNFWPMSRKTAVRRLFVNVATDSEEMAMALGVDDRVINLDETGDTATTVDEPSSYEVSQAGPVVINQERETVHAGGAPPAKKTAAKKATPRGRGQQQGVENPGAQPAGEGGPTQEDIAAMRAEAAAQAAEHDATTAPPDDPTFRP